jgi:DNA-binding CsgD family transcriptional regulator
VLRLSAGGLTRAEIGDQLRFGSSTVRDIRRDICTKLGASSMQVAIVIAMRVGLLE